jgi:hypothetical protein
MCFGNAGIMQNVVYDVKKHHACGMWYNERAHKNWYVCRRFCMCTKPVKLGYQNHCCLPEYGNYYLITRIKRYIVFSIIT